MNKMVRLAMCFALAISSTPLSVLAEESGTAKLSVQQNVNGAVQNLTKQILIDDIELEKFNLRYRLEAAKQGRWKGLRFFTLQEMGTGASGAGLIVGLVERGSHIHHWQGPTNPNILCNGGILPQAVGQTIGASSDALELAINGYHKLEASKHGFSAQKSRAFVKNLMDTIDTEMAAREKLIKEQPDDIGEMHVLESKVLQDFRNLSVSEFERFHIGSRRLIAQQQAFYFLDCAKNVTGAIGTVYAYRAIHERYRPFNVPAGILAVVSGSLTMADPIASRVWGRMISKIQEENLKKSGFTELNTDAAACKSDCDALRAYCDSHKIAENPVLASSLNRLKAYEESRDQFLSELDRGSKELRKGNRIAVQNMGSGAFVGASKIGTGVPLLVAGAKYPHSAMITNSLIFSGTISFLTGTSYAFLDNARIQAKRELDNHRLAKAHQLPAELVHARLDKLDALQKQL